MPGVPSGRSPRGLVKPENIAVTGVAANFTKTLIAGRQCLLSANVDIWYRLDGAAAVNGATSALLRAGNRSLLVFDGVNGTVSVIQDSVAGRATLEEVVTGS